MILTSFWMAVTTFLSFYTYSYSKCKLFHTLRAHTTVNMKKPQSIASQCRVLTVCARLFCWLRFIHSFIHFIHSFHSFIQVYETTGMKRGVCSSVCAALQATRMWRRTCKCLPSSCFLCFNPSRWCEMNLPRRRTPYPNNSKLKKREDEHDHTQLWKNGVRGRGRSISHRVGGRDFFPCYDMGWNGMSWTGMARSGMRRKSVEELAFEIGICVKT